MYVCDRVPGPLPLEHGFSSLAQLTFRAGYLFLWGRGVLCTRNVQQHPGSLSARSQHHDNQRSVWTLPNVSGRCVCTQSRAWLRTVILNDWVSHFNLHQSHLDDLTHCGSPPQIQQVWGSRQLAFLTGGADTACAGTACTWGTAALKGGRLSVLWLRIAGAHKYFLNKPSQHLSSEETAPAGLQ